MKTHETWKKKQKKNKPFPTIVAFWREERSLSAFVFNGV